MLNGANLALIAFARALGSEGRAMSSRSPWMAVAASEVASGSA
jgi:NADH:ubiquinone oxidoreductase subunit K